MKEFYACEQNAREDNWRKEKYTFEVKNVELNKLYAQLVESNRTQKTELEEAKVRYGDKLLLVCMYRTFICTMY